MSGTNETKTDAASIGSNSKTADGSEKDGAKAPTETPRLFLDLLQSADGSRPLKDDPEFLKLSFPGKFVISIVHSCYRNDARTHAGRFRLPQNNSKWC